MIDFRIWHELVAYLVEQGRKLVARTFSKRYATYGL